MLAGAVRATHTLSFIALKPGLLTLDGPDYGGEVSVAGFGLDARALGAERGWVAGPELFSSALAPRPRNFHKGMAGSVAILGGADGMVGAALLAGRAALGLGAGRVYCGLLAHEALAVDPVAPELMLRHPDEALGLDVDAFVVGPGLGQGERAETLVGAAIASELPCVLDADALNLIAESEDLRRACARRRAETLLTPHPGEAARLLVMHTADVQANRLAAARNLSANLKAHALLKGNGSVIAARGERLLHQRFGQPGHGERRHGRRAVGILGALLAQGVPGEAALVLGTHLHGCAADALSRSARGRSGCA